MPQKKNAFLMPWSEIKTRLKPINERLVLDMLRDLYELSSENKRFMSARLSQNDGESLEAYRHEIMESLNPSFDNPLDLQRGRKAISGYQKAAPHDAEGLLDLMLVYVESGNAYTMDNGDINETFYDSLCSMMSRIQKSAPTVGLDAHACCAKRLRVMADMPSIGWGYSDWLAEVTDEVESSLEKRKKYIEPLIQAPHFSPKYDGFPTFQPFF